MFVCLFACLATPLGQRIASLLEEELHVMSNLNFHSDSTFWARSKQTTKEVEVRTDSVTKAKEVKVPKK